MRWAGASARADALRRSVKECDGLVTIAEVKALIEERRERREAEAAQGRDASFSAKRLKPVLWTERMVRGRAARADPLFAPSRAPAPVAAQVHSYAEFVGTASVADAAHFMGRMREEAAADKRLSLTATELMQVVDHRPTHAVEAQLLVEECAERLDEDRVETLLGVLFKAVAQELADITRGGDA